MKLQKLGGYAAILSVMCGTGMNWFYFIDNDLMNNPIKIRLFCILMIIWSIFILITFLVLHERWKDQMPVLMRIMLITGSAGVVLQVACRITIIGGIGLPSEYTAVFERIVSGFHLASIHAIAWASLFLGVAILRMQSFSLILGWLFTAIGVWWIPTHVIPIPPELQILKIIDHLLFGVCFVWIGIAMICNKQPELIENKITKALE